MKKPKTDTIKIGTYFDFDTEIKGDIITKSNVKVDGKIIGSLTSSQDVVIGEKCVVEGNVSGRDIIVNGCVKGNVFAEETVTLANKGKIEGDVRGTGFIVDIGSQYSGKCTIVEPRADGKKSIEAKIESQEVIEPKPESEKTVEPKIESKKAVEPKKALEAVASLLSINLKEKAAPAENKKAAKANPNKIVVKELEPAAENK